jgi:hypothetical protein
MRNLRPEKAALVVLLASSLAAPTLSLAESGAFASSSNADGTVNTMRSYNPGPGAAYSYSSSRPGYAAPYYPYYSPSRSDRSYNSSRQRAFNRNNWSGDNRVNYWNDVISDMVSDMFGESAGDFDFDLNVKFRAKGDGRGKGKARGNTYEQYRGDYHGDIRNQGNYYGSGYTRQYPGYSVDGYPAYGPPPYSYYGPATPDRR